MSSAWDAASSAVVDRPVISETPAPSPAVIVTPPAPALIEPVDEEEMEDEEDNIIVVVPSEPESGQGKESSDGGWWSWIKGTISDAKDWVVGLVDGS